MLKGIWEDTRELLRQKEYSILLILTAVLSYGFMIGNPTIGIDDTATELYFQDGMAPYVGRWVLFLINKVFYFAEFAPFLTEFAALIFMILSVTIWCVAFKRILGDKIPIWGYTFFSCIFISAPILSEVFTYYMHNGIGIAYGLAAAGAIVFAEGMKCNTWKRWGVTAVSALLVMLAAGCYESLVVVYIIGIVMMYLLLCKEKSGQQYDRRLFHWMIQGIMSIATAMIARSLVITVIKVIYKLDEKIIELPTRGLSGVLQWVNGTNTLGEFTMLLKRFLLKYYINALAYFPITIFVIAAMVLIIYCIVQTFRYKNPILLLCGAAILLIPWMMIVIEAQATPYRASQYVPLVCSFSVLLLLDLIQETTKGKLYRMLWCAAFFGMTVCTFNQCTEMNKWFYVDYLKYEDAKNTMNTIAYELEKSYDIQKPVIFVGGYQVPDNILGDAGLHLNSEEFWRIRRITDVLDEHLKEKYYTVSGYYKLAEVPYLSVINWGISAFDRTNEELFKFLEMHGHSFILEKELERYQEAEAFAKEKEIPSWPKDGYIQETEEYIVVKMGDFQ